LTSTPAENARSPAARSTTAWIASSSRMIGHNAANSSHIRWLKALRTSGRLSVIVAT
jgi:hypothetical protein